MSKAPLVSIVLGTYNRATWLPRALDSLLAQSFRDFELILLDNASTDGTADLCRRYADADPRIRYHRHDANVGMVANYDCGVRMARNPYMLLASDDDEWRADFIEANVRCLEENSSLVLSYTGVAYVECNGNAVILAPYPKLSDSDPYVRARESIEYGGRATGQGVPLCGVFRTRLVRDFRPIPPCYGPDIVRLLEIALAGRCHVIAEPMLLKRKPIDRGQNPAKRPFYGTGYVNNPMSRFCYCTRIYPLQFGLIWRSRLDLGQKLTLSRIAWQVFVKRYLPDARRYARTG